MERKLLNTYRGFTIEKAWDEVCGTQINVEYTAYMEDGRVFDTDRLLHGLKRRINDSF